MPSLQVAQTTSAQPTSWLLFSFKFGSAFRPWSARLLITCIHSGTFFTCDRTACPMTLTFKLDLNRVKLNQHAEHLGQWSYQSKVTVHSHMHTHVTEYSTWTTGMIGKYSKQSCSKGYCFDSPYVAQPKSCQGGLRFTISSYSHLKYIKMG